MCAVTTLLDAFMNWIGLKSQVSEGGTVGNCKINRFHFADDLVLLVPSEQGLQHALMIGFLLHETKKE